MRTIDGQRGEGGGQVLRTTLALSLLQGEPVRLVNIRANRKKPGLQPQHLTAVRLAAQVGNAQVEGAAVGAREIVFRPRQVQPGHYELSIGTAGSATLVFQTVLPALLRLDAPTTLAIDGGTYNEHAPPVDFVQRAFLPVVNRLGVHVTVEMERAGFYPAGGGRLRARIVPTPVLRPFELLERGPVRLQARALVARLPASIAQRELAILDEALGIRGSVETLSAASPGNAVLVEAQSDAVTEVFSAIGRRGVRAEHVAQQAADAVRAYLASDAPVGPHLADQLLLPLALAGAGSFRAQAPLTLHATTQLELLRDFGHALRCEPDGERAVRIEATR